MHAFTRLTNAFSKTVENFALATALHIIYYNFVRIHKALLVTPVVAARLTGKLRETADIAQLIAGAEEAPKARGP